MQEVEGQLQQEYETSREQIGSLEDQLMAEKRRRDDAEIEVSKQKQVRYITIHFCCWLSSSSALWCVHWSSIVTTTKYVLPFFDRVAISLHRVAPVICFWDAQATISRAGWGNKWQVFYWDLIVWFMVY